MIFSLRQLQEKCREQQKPLYIAFIDLTKAFDLVSRSGLFSLLQKIGCPPRLLQMVKSFHEDMHSTVYFNGGTSDAFPVSSGVKQGCVLAPTLFGIFFFMLLQEVLIREMLFADDAALTSHTEAGLQELVSRLSNACKEFGLTISLKKTNILAQDTDSPPDISIDKHASRGGGLLHLSRRLLHIKWQDRVTNIEVLQRAGIPSLFSLLRPETPQVDTRHFRQRSGFV
nr:hypothetical protein BaRGS_005024 [Batillaria attramentaria]